MTNKRDRLTICTLLTLATALGAISLSNAQSILALKQTSGSPVTVYFLPLHSATYIPVGEELIKSTGGKTIISSEALTVLLKSLQVSPSLKSDHNEMFTKFDHNNVRLRVEASRGEHLIFVDSKAVVDNAGKVYKLSEASEKKLNQLINAMENSSSDNSKAGAKQL